MPADMRDAKWGTAGQENELVTGAVPEYMRLLHPLALMYRRARSAERNAAEEWQEAPKSRTKIGNLRQTKGRSEGIASAIRLILSIWPQEQVLNMLWAKSPLAAEVVRDIIAHPPDPNEGRNKLVGVIEIPQVEAPGDDDGEDDEEEDLTSPSGRGSR